MFDNTPWPTRGPNVGTTSDATMRLAVNSIRKAAAISPFDGIRGRPSATPTRPVTPEVAGSSPVAPVKNPCKLACSVVRIVTARSVSGSKRLASQALASGRRHSRRSMRPGARSPPACSISKSACASSWGGSTFSTSDPCRCPHRAPDGDHEHHRQLGALNCHAGGRGLESRRSSLSSGGAHSARGREAHYGCAVV